MGRGKGYCDGYGEGEIYREKEGEDGGMERVIERRTWERVIERG